MNLIRTAGLALIGVAILVEPALATVRLWMYLLPLWGLVCQRSSFSAAHIGSVESFLVATNKFLLTHSTTSRTHAGKFPSVINADMVL
jgi:hypothetical protein